MAGTISPVGNGAQRRRLLIAHGFGLLLGATTMAAALTLGAALLHAPLQAAETWLTPVLVLVLLGWASRSAFGKGLPYPLPRWQVPQDWRHALPAMVTLPAYGYLLGLGVLTNMVVPTYWLLVGMSLWMGGLVPLLVAWTLYAAGRLVTTWRATEMVARGFDDTTAYVPRGVAVVRHGAGALLVIAAAGLLF